MQTFDFSPLFRSTVGFDRMMQLLEAASRLDEAAAGYPPYNIEKTGDDAYRITMAVAGFTKDDLSVEVRDNTLVISGKHREEADEGDFLYRGIAGRSFQRTFQLADFVRVAGAHLTDGLLHIDLVREVPEEMRPRRIEISTSAPARLASKAKKLVSSVRKAA